MSKTSYITARVEPALKASAEGVLKELGVSTTDAITMFLRQVVLRRGLPFAVRLPNAESRKAIEELAKGRGRQFASSEELLQDALGKRETRKR